MGFVGERTREKVAVISIGYDAQLCQLVCQQFAENGVEISHISPNGRWPVWAPDESKLSFEEGGLHLFSALLLMTDKRGSEILMDTSDFDYFVRSFIERKRPVVAIGDGVMLLGVLGHLHGIRVSCEDESALRLRKFGAEIADGVLCVDNGILTASKSVDMQILSQNFLREIAKGRHAEQLA